MYKARKANPGRPQGWMDRCRIVALDALNFNSRLIPRNIFNVPYFEMRRVRWFVAQTQTIKKHNFLKQKCTCGFCFAFCWGSFKQSPRTHVRRWAVEDVLPLARHRIVAPGIASIMYAPVPVVESEGVFVYEITF